MRPDLPAPVAGKPIASGATGWWAAASPRLLASFGRVGTGGRFIAEIDGLRFIAIGTVLLFHLAVDLAARAPLTYALPSSGLLVTLAGHGFHGVELFFIISGFVLALPFAAHHLAGRPAVPIASYFLRRVTRLEPPYVLSLLVLITLLVLVRGRSAAELMPHLAASLVYQHSLIYGEESAINNVAWSLEIEIQFYLLVPLLSQLFAIRSKARRRATVVLLCTGSVLLEAFVLSPGQLAWLSILRFFHFFLAGFLLADVYLVDWKERPTRSFTWDGVSLAGWPLLFWIWDHFPGNPRPGEHPSLLPAAAFPAIAFVLYVAAFRGRLTNRIICNPWITTYGGMCYSVYLVHNPTFGLVLRATSRLAPFGSWAANYLLQVAVVLPAMSVLAAIFFLLVEKPCMRRDWPQRAWLRLRGGPAPGGQASRGGA